MILCYVCKNKWHDELPYFMKDNFYSHMECGNCKEKMEVCFECMKYVKIQTRKPSTISKQLLGLMKYPRVCTKCEYVQSPCEISYQPH